MSIFRFFRDIAGIKKKPAGSEALHPPPSRVAGGLAQQPIVMLAMIKLESTKKRKPGELTPVFLFQRVHHAHYVHTVLLRV